nr:hypothetical protein [Tanacetum cinerariifolium]
MYELIVLLGEDLAKNEGIKVVLISLDNDDLTSSDDESLSEEDVPIEESKVYSNPLFDDDEINYDELESHVESNFVESLSTHDALIDSSQKIDYLEEFSDEEVDAIKELHVDNSISNSENELSDNGASDFDNPSVPLPPPEPPDAEFDFKQDAKEEISVAIDKLECLNPNDKFDVLNDEDVNYYSFMFVIYLEMFLLLHSAESEDTIFNPGISV